MRMCSDHWTKCKEAIQFRGLSHLVKDADTIRQVLTKQLEGGSLTNQDYDPLFDLNLMLSKAALECGGLYLLTVKEDGTEYCPLCEAKTHGVDPEVWIKGASDAILAHCKQEGLQG